MTNFPKITSVAAMLRPKPRRGLLFNIEIGLQRFAQGEKR